MTTVTTNESTTDHAARQAPDTGTNMAFADGDSLRDALRENDYIADDDLATVVHLATVLDRPLLLEGPAGVGKTELAKSLAEISGRKLIRLQCHEGLDDSRTLYEWDYARQLLHVQMLRDRISTELAQFDTMREASQHLAEQDFGIYTETFLAARPLLAAILSEEPVVLLIDEVDRTEESMEALLLEVLAENQVTVPEIGTFTARTRPWVVLTSNDTRELSAALKRRCLHYHLGYPTAERERDIVAARAPEVERAAVADVVELAGRMRELPLRKSPSISEVIDAARISAVLAATGRDPAQSPEVLYSALLKYSSDVDLMHSREHAGTTQDNKSAASTTAPAGERVTVASNPANTTTAVFRGRGGKG